MAAAGRQALTETTDAFAANVRPWPCRFQLGSIGDVPPSAASRANAARVERVRTTSTRVPINVKGRNGGSRDLAIVEKAGDACCGLAGLVTLASNDQQVAGTEFADSR